MSEKSENYEEPNEIEFRPSSKEVKLGKITEVLNDYGKELLGEFKWFCKSCGEKNSDSRTIKPHERFWASWYCKKCKKITTMWFPPVHPGSWLSLVSNKLK